MHTVCDVGDFVLFLALQLYQLGNLSLEVLNNVELWLLVLVLVLIIVLIGINEIIEEILYLDLVNLFLDLLNFDSCHDFLANLYGVFY